MPPVPKRWIKTAAWMNPISNNALYFCTSKRCTRRPILKTTQRAMPSCIRLFICLLCAAPAHTAFAQLTELLPVPGGTFTMGCTPGQQPCDAGTTAAHPVTVRPFYLSAREVTQAQYAAAMGANPAANTACPACPVENTSWYDAVRYCNALSTLEGRQVCYYADNTLSTPFNAASGTVYWDTEADGYRLPTEAEWEYAARAGTDLRYAGSNTATDVGWFGANSGGQTRPDTLAPNALGLYNLSGNVEEWVWDAFENYPAYAECDPTGPTAFGVNRVRRGGHYASGADGTVSRRSSVSPASKSATGGFRVCSNAPGLFVYVPAGTYTMGCTPDQQGQCEGDESPDHPVTLSAFYMGKYEVTQGEWSALMSDINPSGTPYFTACGTDCPVEQVSWFDLAVYCNRLSEQQGLEPCYYSDAGYIQVYGKSGNNWNLPNTGTVFWKTTAKGYRLPTEAEWEYAARGAGANPQTRYSGSDDIDAVAWWVGNSQVGYSPNFSGQGTWPRGQKVPNALGLYDMSGNVWEWCFDWYDSDYYDVSPPSNPLGLASGSVRVVRGGSWLYTASFERVAHRGIGTLDNRYNYIGFRLCRSAATPSCTTLTSPAPGATNVPPTAALTWPAVPGATGYRLRAGTTPGGFDLLTDVDNGNTTTYTPSANWPAGNTVYVMVLPYNAEGPAIACGVSSFTVEPPSAPPGMEIIPSGTYTMGCTPDQQGQCDFDENPPHAVTLSAFYLGKYEVTQGEWSALMSDINPSGTPFFTACGADCPVEGVSWYDAAVYCNRLSEQQGLEPCYYSDAGFTSVYGKSGSNWSLPNTGTVFWKTAAKGYRLPTEAEWEYAARGAGANPQTRYSGSDDIDAVAWWDGNSLVGYSPNSGGQGTWPRGQKTPNALGLYDMSGNVWEWCFDWYSDGYYSVSPPANPTGPVNGSSRVLRGGSWVNYADGCRVAHRTRSTPGNRDYNYGFRVARSPQ